MLGLHRRLQASRAAAVGLSLALLAAVAVLDWATGVELSFALFYFIPVGVASWYVGLPAGLAEAAASTVAWYALDPRGPASSSGWAVPAWNTAIRAAYFTLTALAVSNARRLIERERNASQLKSDMLSFVSHELNNSLTSLGMALFMLEDEPQDAARRAGVLASMHRTLEQMQRAAVNFLESARLESGRFTLDRRRCELRALLADSLDLLRPLADKKGVRLSLDLPAEPVPLDADPDALAVIMANLVGNAVKYTPAGGEAAIRLESGRPAPGSVTVTVADTGIGMSEEDRKRVLQAFHRAEEGRRAARGFGIGLSVVQRLLEAHGSRLDAAGAPGKGSAFSFVLPVYSDGLKPPTASPSR
ncbi:MAG: HAMP domain-containing histidine kinase [Elusimicrobia bacterium]|nr:HAMP domain-containing histidine kinase [Elusimicrobiota bacterium]